MEVEAWRRQFAVMTNAYRQFSLRYCLDSLERLGIRQVDLWGGEPHFYAGTATYRETRNLEKMARERGLRIVCLTPEVLDYPLNLAAEEPEARERTWLYGKRCLEICEDLGIPQLLLGPGWGYENHSLEDGRKRAAGMLARLAEEAQKRGVRIATQHLTRLSSNLVHTPEDLRQVLEESGAANLEAVVDVGILYGRGETEEVWWKHLQGRIGRIHFMDGWVGKPSPHLAAGDGNLPLADIYRNLEKMGYRGGYTWEVNAPQYGREPEQALRRCVEAMRVW